MDYEAARELATILKSMDASFNAAAEVIERIGSEEERREFRRALAYVVGRIYTDMLVPIGQEYPDLSSPES